MENAIFAPRDEARIFAADITRLPWRILNRGPLDLQSNALSLRYAPGY